MKTIEEASLEYAIHMEIDANDLQHIGEYQKAFKAGYNFANHWIPVEEDLPELGEKGYSKNVLICDDPQDEDDARIGYRITDIGTGITHWNNNEHPAYWRPIKFE